MTDDPTPPAITQQELEEMKRCCENATPGKWVCEQTSTRQGTRYQHIRSGPKGIADTYHHDRIVSQAADIALGGDGDGFVEARHGNGGDAAFIAHARTDLPRCIAEIERLRHENAGLFDQTAKVILSAESEPNGDGTYWVKFTEDLLDKLRTLVA